jgi:hypothetical protein
MLLEKLSEVMNIKHLTPGVEYGDWHTTVVALVCVLVAFFV